MLEDIKRMTAELTDKMPVKYIEIAGLLFRHKCTIFSVSPYVSSMWLIYMAESFSYKVKNLKNAVNYKNDWKIHICILPSMNDKSLINLAVIYLKEKTQEFWMNNYMLIKIWNKYIEWY